MRVDAGKQRTMEFVAYQTADELLLSDIKQEIPDEVTDETSFGVCF